MDKLFKKLSGIFFAALLTASLGGKAKADNEDASLPEPAPTAIVAPAPASAPSAPAASAGSSGSSGSSAASESQSKPAENKPAESKPAENKPAENKPAENKPAETASAPASAPEAGAPAPAAGSSAPSAPAASAPAASEGESKPAPAESSAPAQTESAPAPSAPAETPAAPVNEAPAEAPAPAAPAEAPADAPAETPAEVPAETPTEAPVEAPAEAPADSGETAPEAGDEADAGTETPAETPAVSSSGHHKPSGQGGGTAAPRKTGSGNADDAEDGEQETEAEADTAADEAEVPAAAEEAEEVTVTEADEPAEADTEAPAETDADADGEAAAADEAAEPEDAADAENTSAESEEDTITLTLDAEAASQTGAQARSSSGETPANVINLVTDSASNVNSKDDILIKTAGYQHIGTLYSDGDVYIVGTGILLVDSVDLLQGKSVYLESIEEIYGKDGGTVALFIFDHEDKVTGVKTYVLYNGQDDDGNLIPAILDEEYTIPSGISLVVPSGTEIIMQGVNKLYETAIDTNGGEHTHTSYSTTGTPASEFEGKENIETIIPELTSTAPQLTVSGGASMIIESGASFLLRSLIYKNTLGVWLENQPLLVIDGLFSTDSNVSGGAVDISASAALGGTGAFDSAHITVSNVGADASTAPLALNIIDSTVYLSGVNGTGSRDARDLLSLKVLAGNTSSTVGYSGPLSIGSILVEEGTLYLQSSEDYGSDMAVTVTDSISGSGSVKMQSGVIVIEKDAEVARNNIVTFDFYQLKETPYAAVIFDYTNTLTGSSIPRSEPNELAPGSESVPVIGLDIIGSDYTEEWEILVGRREANYESSDGKWIDDTIAPLDLSEIDTVDLELLHSLYPAQLNLGENLKAKYDFVLVEVCVDGVYGFVRLNESNSVSASVIERICFLNEGYGHPGTGGGTSTTTNTSFTGSGILGGSGAGSVTGGSQRFALGGTRLPAPDPKPDPEPDPAPTAATRPAAAQADSDVRIWTEPEAADECYELHIEIDGEAVGRVARPVEVRMKYALAPEAADLPLYVVFVDAGGDLRAFAAYYDEETGELVFSSDISGTFAVVVFSFDGKLFSAAFYDALAELAPVKTLLD